MFLTNEMESMNIHTVSMKKCNSSYNKNTDIIFTFDKANKTDISKIKHLKFSFEKKHSNKSGIKTNIITNLVQKIKDKQGKVKNKKD
jgi:hypothetical protein